MQSGVRIGATRPRKRLRNQGRMKIVYSFSCVVGPTLMGRGFGTNLLNVMHIIGSYICMNHKLIYRNYKHLNTILSEVF